jgi:nitrite reductase/ring-hydroxylating ferredoxin subunit/uncharacterized membrane protein
MSGLAEAGHRAVTALERQDWLQPVEEKLQGLVASALAAAGRRVRNLLHGTWLGHALHPVLTDVPIGAWTMAVVFDILDARSRGWWRRRYDKAADRAVVVGIIGAGAAAVTGMADWSYTSGRSRRTGLVHAVMNTAALGLWTASLMARRRGARGAGRTLGGVGYGILLAAAYLGGTLVYRYRLGVDQSDRPTDTVLEAYFDVHDLPEGARRRVDLQGIPIVLVRHGGRVYALGERCSHMGGPLSEGTFENGTVVCPWHGSRFALADGRVIDGPATMNQPCFEVREASGRVVVRRAA